MKRLLLLLICLTVAATAVSADLGSQGARMISSAGVQIFPGADYLNGNQDVGYRFATAASLDEVRAWYRQKLPEWALYNDYGGWILYDGKSGAGLGALMSLNQVAVKENRLLHDWFGIDPSMTTEIVIILPNH